MNTLKRAALAAVCLIVLSPAWADGPDVVLVKLTPRVWAHTSYAVVGGVRVDSHGLAVDTGEGVILVDTAWDDEETEALLALIRRDIGRPVILAVITHAHADRIGGIGALLKNKIKAVATPLTALKAAAAGYPAPRAELDPAFIAFTFGKTEIDVYFPGPGHTEDNLTVWVPADRVLFGGCLVKSLESPNLGNTAEADIGRWAGSVRNLKKKFPRPALVVPGHGKWGGPELLDHTIALAEKR